MSLEKVVDKLIQEAMARGEFENLEGAGKPIDLTAYFNTPEDLRMGYSLLKSNKFVPEEVDLIREISDLRKQLNETTDIHDKRAISEKLNDKTLALDLAFERYKRRR